MRDIKFRAWNGIELRQVDQITISEKAWRCESGYGVSIPYSPHIVLMQYTGLKDKNGKEIYEGDIVRAWYMYRGEPTMEFMAYIIYNEHIGSFRIAYDSIGGGSQDEIYFKHQVEVIGNIYENPELLK